MKNFTLALAGVSVLVVAGCVKQPDADKKMAEGCKGAIGAMIAPKTVKELKSFTAGDDTSEGSIHRRLKIVYIENDDFADIEKNGECLFSQQWGFLNSTHAALLEQVVYEGKVLGKQNGVIQGSMEEFIKLTNGASTAMGQ